MEQLNNHDNDVIDLREILAILRKRYMVIVVLTLAALVTSGILSFFVLAPVYETKAVLLVTQAAPDKPAAGTKDEGLEGLMNTISRLPEMTINTYVGQLKSEAVLEKVIKKLKIDQNGYTVRSLANAIQVVAVKDTNLVEVKVSNTDPYLAAKIANTLTGEFLDFMSATNEEQMGKSVEFLKKQAVATGEELKKALTNLNKLESQPRGAVMLEQLLTAKSQDLSKYQSQLLQVSMEHQQLLAGKQQAEVQLKSTPPTIKTTGDNAGSGTPVQLEEANPAYTELKTMVNAKTVAAAEKAAENKSLQLITGKLNEELKNLQAELGQKKNVLELTRREATRLEETNTLLRSKIDETKIGRSMKFGETNLVVVSPAMLPNAPVKPNKTMNMAVALVLGLMVSVGLAFLLNYLDNTVKNPKEAEEVLGLPVLGQIPYYNLDKKPETTGRY